MKLKILFILIFYSISLMAKAEVKEATDLLHTASKDGDFEKISLAIQQGANVHRRDSVGWTPLLRYIVPTQTKQNIRLPILDYLVENGANINSQGDHGEGIPHLIVSLENDQSESWKIIQWFKEKGGRINLKDSRRKTALYFVRNLKITQVFFELGGDFNMRDNMGNSPIYDQIFSKNIPIIKFFIETARVNLNITNFLGQNPLHHLVRYSYESEEKSFQIAEILIENMSNQIINQKNSDGLTAVALAKKRGNNELADFLEEKIAVKSEDAVPRDRGAVAFKRICRDAFIK